MSPISSSSRVPPLRERPEDAVVLGQHFLTHYAKEAGRRLKGISPDGNSAIAGHDWPGNVRELENFIERAMIMYQGSPAIRFDVPGSAGAVESASIQRARNARWSIADLEREHIFSVLEETRGNQTKASEILGIDRRTLYRKLKRYELADGAN